MELHIGQEIKRVLKEKGKKANWLAEKINTGDRNFYDMLTRDELSTSQLAQISEALEYDFFALYQKQLPGMVAEPFATYGAIKTRVSVLIELDGSIDTLKQWFGKLEKINAAL